MITDFRADARQTKVIGKISYRFAVQLVALFYISAFSLARAQPLSGTEVPITGVKSWVLQQNSAALPQESRVAAVEATISIESGKLVVNANNSSLDQIVRTIARRYNMKMTGSVQDERVYGSYGPADVSTILSALLDGTGTNVVLKHTVKEAGQIILTPRTGSVVPPGRMGSNSSSSVMSSASESSYGRHPKEFPDSKREPSSAAYAPGGGGGNLSAAPAQPLRSGLERSPNGIKLPDEIKAGLLLLEGPGTVEPILR